MTLGELAGRLVVPTPHAGLAIPTSVREQFTLSDAELMMEAHGSADLRPDALGQSAFANSEPSFARSETRGRGDQKHHDNQNCDHDHNAGPIKHDDACDGVRLHEKAF